ncbi:type III secretion system invasion protein IagB [Leclercia adecarboxylata]|uniref:type III secretion system invasion protein IagB n=1 Tax=Leclercia TaxID=83654 RepID=UPI0012E96AEF|nr:MULTISPECIES: type III secretion system invasion protein IagB [Leclercia]MCZ7841085.1 type III secretion system invasion protein IagB [Leclercia adecarboxylata]MEB5749076.1 type III secretion system invasion protein IagB [Leclercia adecarboxylata]QGW16397.1 type III secretion system invasion protein IagB [Leclercia sp. Colony189]QVV59496.1 type III secretion system invasion protein IagB [Leclercia sp. Colony189]URM24422.1 type III secretion system invasion protein IagB [Leclercia adecarboxy
MKRVIFLLLLISQGVLANCWNSAGKYYHVDPWLLFAIADVESGLNPNAVGYNHDGSRDVGLMQINSTHFAELEKKGIDEYRLITEPCTSIMVGASILSGMINVYGYNWEAVGAYNAGLKPENYPQRRIYARKVWAKYQRIKRMSQYR